MIAAAVFKSVSRAYHRQSVHIVLYLNVAVGPSFHKDRIRISNSSKREMRLLSLSRKLGHGLDEDFRKAGDRLRNILIRDFERETALTVVFIERNDLTKAARHRAMAHAIHNTLRDLEMMMS